MLLRRHLHPADVAENIVLTEKELQILVLRKEGLLQTEIAKRLNITQGAVSRFEANARAKMREAKTQFDMLRRLGIDVDDVDASLEERLRKVRQSAASKQGARKTGGRL